MLRFLRNIFEKKIFGVSAWWGDRIGVKASLIRMLFIYATFTNAFTILIYLFMIFIYKIRYHFKYKKRKSVFDL
ncbi:MAG: PspC family transcriptional regulator [Flavobacteriales bacterium]|nr:PspC family transcriptional regulator [Flavobacteriales bacterium]MBR76598.1 PspC family transcriptional regulator [Flavobacteriales bacterium]